MVAVPTSNTCRMCGALPARNAAIAAVIDSGYCPLKIATTLYSFWLALKPLVSSLTLSLSAPCIECHQWISVWAPTVPDSRTAPARTPTRISVRMLPPYFTVSECGGIWRARRESNARPMASEAITLSPELRARERKLYTARRGGLRPLSRRRQIVFDEAHGLFDRSGGSQPAFHARPQHAVGAEALDHRDERLPEAVACAQDHRLVLQSEVVHREHLEQLVESADPAGQRDEQVGGFRHQLLPLSERLDDPERAEVGRGAQAAPKSAARERAAAGRSSTAEQNRHTDCFAMSGPDDCVEADVHRRRRLRDAAHGDEIDPGLGDRADGLHPHAAGGLERNPAARERDRAAHVFRAHVVEQNHVSPR